MAITNTSIQQNNPSVDVSLWDLLQKHRTDMFTDFNSHHIGTIQSFNSANQTATAVINYTKTFFNFNASKNKYEPVQGLYPILMDCPVICLGGGTASLTFPITKGDECLIIFNDRSIDNWFQSGQIGPINDARLHHISDGIILVGLRSSQKVLSGYDTSRAVLKNDQAYVGVSSTHIKIANNLTTLNTLLQDLITQIEAITVTTDGVTSSVPNNSAAFVAIGTRLGGLLE